MRRSHDDDTGKAAIYMVSAWATTNQAVLGQRKVDDKSNEINAIPELLKLLDVAGCIVTIDAIGTQTEIVKTIVDSGADYLLSVKENQGNHFYDLQYLFEVDAAKGSYTHKVNKGHGRLENRKYWVIDDEEYLAYSQKRERWPGLKSIFRIIAKREMSEKVEIQISYFIASLPADTKAIPKAKHSQWKIENQLHWVLDIAFREDDSRFHKDHGPENLAILRHMMLNLLKMKNAAKGGIHAKRLQAGWSNYYWLSILKS